jgi:succinate dehydrogenase / fumarate reductase cytochrome b subunit
MLLMAADNRPLSPHLQIYRPQITSILSILHRISGVILSLGLVVLVYWLASAAAGPEAYAGAVATLGSGFGKFLMFGWTLAFFYHLLNGIRHLVWDSGRGFEIPEVYRSGWTVVVLSLVMTAVFWVAVMAGGAQ